MRFDILTLFPGICRPPLEHSILGRAASAGHVSFGVHDIRDHGRGRHRVVDDTPYGGGSGMVMRVDVIDEALQEVWQPTSHVVLMAPTGRPFRQADARRLAAKPHVVLVCGHYEGVDGRVAAHLVDEVLSIGDYVLTGGELAAVVICDAVARLVPGVLGNAGSLEEESFEHGLLEAPAYTRPFEYRDWSVPEVLRSGHHARIAAWRKAQSEALTQAVRPDLWAEYARKEVSNPSTRQKEPAGVVDMAAPSE
ncbi:MAG: tRNA (guanosine(37)-N1)-methyltransferase TrmD [Deltaproteobacteria bacterium]|nr:tRNA (guanosine(37)-N1)-methyltransferase TrmD [Deltaproteobacteria bacterium]HCH62668.1 tRNA (guanosine(37)-N1)-methyltransferase TrmD [Deltaproteobacteria bacterium]